MPRSASIVYTVHYPDGRINLSARVRINENLMQRTRMNTPDGKKARDSVSIQVKKAIQKEYGKSLRWVDFNRISFKKEEELPAE